MLSVDEADEVVLVDRWVRRHSNRGAPMNRRIFITSLFAVATAGASEAAYAKGQAGLPRAGRSPRKGRATKRNFYAGDLSSRSTAVGSFASCAEARAAGHSRMGPSDPGYSRKLDRDGDGIACE
jgi:hypothetical protein